MKINSLKRHKWLAVFVGSLLLSSSVYAAVSTPVVTSYPSFASSTPVTVSGTGDASTTVNIAGGASPSSASVDGSGNWSASVDLTANTVNSLSITEDDGLGSTSPAATIDITFDNTAPVFGTTTDVTATTTSSSGTTVTFTNPSATDNMSASTTVACDPASDTNFAVGTTTVNCTASDESGNTASASFSVFVDQVSGSGTTTPLVLAISSSTPAFSSTTPITLTGTALASSTISVTGGASAASTTADVMGNWNVLVNLILNALNHLTVTADDGMGNTSSTTVDITHDNIAPVFGTTTDIMIDATSTLGVSVNFNNPSTTDNFDTSVDVSCTPASGTLFASGSTTVMCIASDDASNTASTTFGVFVNATTTPPEATSTPPVEQPGGHHHSIAGLVNASANANPNSAVAYVLAGLIISDRAPGVPNTGFSLGQFVSDLRVGDSGTDVMNLQVRLTGAGIYHGPLTGYFGALTKAAVEALQRGLSIPVTGSLDANTRFVLNES